MVMVKKNEIYPEHISLSEAVDILIREFSSYKCQIISLEPGKALGLALAEDVVSRRNVPHYTASAVDGYVVRSHDTAGATGATPVTLDEGSFVWVNTGMPVEGGDSVVMVEDTSLSDESGIAKLIVSRSLTQGENVRAVGEDVMFGQIIATEGDEVTPALASLLLCAGIAEVSVRSKPRAIFIPTGNEIVDKTLWLANENEEPGVVVNSNAEFASATFAKWGYSLDIHLILPDDPDLISAAVAKATDEYDLVLVSAGSAKGKRDHSAEIFSSLGRMLFRYARIKPGRPVMAANISGKPVVCTPGFPMSCAVSLWSVVYPLLKTISGERLEEKYIPEAINSVGTTDASFLVQHSSPPGISEWLRMKLAEVDGDLKCWSLSAGASVLWALAESDGIAVIPESALEHEKGSRVEIMLTKHVDFSRRLLFQGSDDPAVQMLISRVRRHGMDLAIRAVGSMGGLAALGRGEAHFAAAHLLDPEDGRYNDSYIERFAAGRKWERTLLFYREQGLIVAAGNPKNVRGFEDLVTGSVTFENRQPGAGTRVLLDYMLRSKGLDASNVPGYDRQSITHMEAANKVASGVADATLGIKAAADALGLTFIPVAKEPYEFVFGESFVAHPAAATLLDALESEEWRASVTAMGGYEWP